MTYQAFLQDITNAVEWKLPTGTRVQLRKIPFNNNILRDGLSFSSKHQFLSPLIYLDSSYCRVSNGELSLNSAADEIVAEYHKASAERQFDRDSIMDYRKMRSKIIYRLVNYDRNKQKLENMPHIPYQDLAVIFYALVTINEKNDGSIRVENSLMDIWDVKVEELWQIATENTKELLPPVLSSMENLIEEVYPHTTLYDEPLFPGPEDLAFPMYILTNSAKHYGCSAILYPGQLKSIRRIFSEDFFILPSSVHEVILIPDSYVEDYTHLNDIIRSCNNECIIPEEYLSDHAYHYNGRTDTVSFPHEISTDHYREISVTIPVPDSEDQLP